MKLLNKILVPISFNESSAGVIKQAISLAKLFNSEILIFHVLPKLEISKLNLEMIEKGINKKLDQIQSDMVSEGVRVSNLGLLSGVPSLEIIKASEKNNANVILLGSGRTVETSKSDTSGLGETAKDVLRKSSKPVWIVNCGQKEKTQYILCPIDFSKASERALKNAIHLSRKMDSTLHILHVVPSILDFYLSILGGSEEKKAEKIKTHEKKLEKFLTQFDLTGIKYTKTVKQGKVHQIILETARELEADIIVLGATGESINPKLLLGSNTELVSREFPCSLIVVKSESIIQPMIDYQISDIKDHYELGIEYLNNGMPEEAKENFLYCIELDSLYTPAWEGLAQSYERLGKKDLAKEYYQKAKMINEKLWQKKVEAELRTKHDILGKL
ncbi:MAG: universal stress protein [Calditrichaceae bacterium]|nr:universal stress protein [Calditrichaceae bacterium]MBN2708598.1 universal stress protein [Calditrichaceae bacterium]RQV95449.1 MAG: hypothetical protein EH224_07465 [Calditrichota bacterium]